jgi:hypothetical protein
MAKNASPPAAYFFISPGKFPVLMPSGRRGSSLVRNGNSDRAILNAPVEDSLKKSKSITMLSRVSDQVVG